MTMYEFCVSIWNLNYIENFVIASLPVICLFICDDCAVHGNNLRLQVVELLSE